MSRTPIVYRSAHRVQFSDLDPFDHMSTDRYATYYVDHRVEGLRDHLGWDAKTMKALGFAALVRRIEIEFLRPARGNQQFTITSHVREFRGSEAVVECTMDNADGVRLSRCSMSVAHVDRQTGRATDWPVRLRDLFFEREQMEAN